MRDFNVFELRRIRDCYEKSLNEAVENFDHVPTMAEISPSNERINVDGDYCRKWYALFNKWYFGNKLPNMLPINVFNFTKDKTTLGFAHCEWKYSNGKVVSVYPTKIEINSIYGFTEYQLFDTLIHEMVHVLDFECFPEHYVRAGIVNDNYKCHGAWFHSECDRINQYGWKISTYDKSGARWSSEYYDSKTEKARNSGRIPLIGFVEKDNGSFFITKTDTKSYMDNAKGCVAQSSEVESKVKAIHYYEISGCKFATIKNYLRYWNSKIASDSSIIGIYKEKGRIPENPFFVFVPDESSSSKGSLEIEYEHMLKNRKKLLRGVLLALSDSIYSSAYSNYDNWSGNAEDLDSIEIASGSYQTLGFKSVNGYPLEITITQGNWTDSSKLNISFDKFDKKFTANMKCGNLFDTTEYRSIVAETIDDLEFIKEEADGMIPKRMQDSWDSMDYRDEVCAPKVVYDRIKGNEFVIANANEIIDSFLISFNDFIERKKNIVGESFILEDSDEDDYETRNHISDEYARHIYDCFSESGDKMTVEVKDSNTIDMGIF